MATFRQTLVKWLTKSHAPENLYGPVYGYSYKQRLGYEDAYELVGWVYRAIRVINTNIQQAKITAVQKIKGRGGVTRLEPLPDIHPLMELLKYPNDVDDMSSMMESVSTHLNLRGEALWEVESNPSDAKAMPTRLISYPPQFINRVVIEGNKPAGYELIVNAQKFTIPNKDAIFFKLFNPRNPFRGLGPMSAAFTAAESDYNAQKFNKRWFDAAIAPGIVVKFKEDYPIESLTPELRERMRTEIQRVYGGVDKSQGVMILGPGQETDKIGNEIKDMSFGNLRKANRDEIFACFGITPIMAGIVEDTNRASAQEERAMFWQDTLIPMLGDVTANLTRKLCPRYTNGQNLAIIGDVSEIPALRPNMKALMDWLLPAIDADTITINEARATYLKMPPVPWGDGPLVEQPNNPQNEDPAAAGGADGKDPKPPKKDPKANPDEPKGLQPSQVRALVSEYKNAVVNRIISGATDPIAAFPLYREANRASKKYGIPQDAAVQLARAIYGELSIVWDKQRPATGASNLFDEFLADIPKDDVKE